jgi:hypothetical protein
MKLIAEHRGRPATSHSDFARQQSGSTDGQHVIIRRHRTPRVRHHSARSHSDPNTEQQRDHENKQNQSNVSALSECLLASAFCANQGLECGNGTANSGRW